MADGYDVPGWFILRLRRHAEGWSGPTVAELADFGPLSQQVTAAIQEATGAPTVSFMSFGENYPHFHFFVIARAADLPEHRVRASSVSAPRSAIATPLTLSPHGSAEPSRPDPIGRLSAPRDL